MRLGPTAISSEAALSACSLANHPGGQVGGQESAPSY